MINTASLIRVADGADIPVSNLTVQIDRDSWCWSLSATLLGRAAHDLIPAYPGRVRATINGFAWEFIVDDRRYSRAFGRFEASITGRSPVAAISAPYAAPSSATVASLRTAAQLVTERLPMDWTLDWTLNDWTVPAGSFAYQNLTPMEQILRVVKATGGMVQADPTDLTLHTQRRWPQRPWAWTSFVPDASLPSSYTLTEALQPKLGAEYEAILVTGGVEGLAVIATRTGTGGATFAGGIADNLLTHLDPATERAAQELADQWPMKQYTLTLPLQASPAGAGLILPGTTFDFVDGEDGWRGLVTGVSISANFNSIQQTLEVVSP